MCAEGIELMKTVALDIPEIMVFEPSKFPDDRGFFLETYNAKTLGEAGVDTTFVQDNQAFSADKWTLRGLHFQSPPFAQDKLVRVLRGSVLDVAVDIRRNSPSYGKHVSVVLSAEAWTQILIPIGFAHAYLTREPDTDVFYKVSQFYAPECESGLLWNDPDLAIDWRAPQESVVLSEKDGKLPLFRNLESPFDYV